MSSTEHLPKAIDLSHHLSFLARQRGPSPFGSKEKYKDRPSIINLDGGIPATDYYPFENLSAEYLIKDAFPLGPKGIPSPPSSESGGLFAWISNLFGGGAGYGNRNDTAELVVPRYAKHGEAFQLATALTYSPSIGLEPLRDFVREFAGRVYAPGYSDWQTLVDIGSTDAWSKVLELLLERGEGFLADEWTYSGALVQARPRDARPVPVKIDAVGLLATDLEKVLEEWDEEARGFKRPHVLYQVTVGQNPTGTTLTAQRKKEIYEVAVKYDLIIVEDDPYYFQQAGVYKRLSQRSLITEERTDKEWVDSLVPSFLRYDYQGRVIRLDTFSKTIGPGSRLGFFTTSPIFRDRLQYTAEGTSQAPCGIGQSLIGTLLLSWGQDGYIRWLRGLQGQYELRRNWALDLFYNNLDIEEEFDAGQSVLVAYPKRKESAEKTEKKSLFEFVPPSAGMFIWFKIHLYNHPAFSHLVRTKSLSSARNELIKSLFDTLVENDVVLRHGYMFQGRTDEDLDRLGEKSAYLRMSYSNVEYEKLEKGIGIFARVVTSFFQHKRGKEDDSEIISW